MIGLIWAESLDGVIGKDNEIPWHVPEDLEWFKKNTEGSRVVMGRKTWESLPVKPLPNRENVVLTSNQNYQAEGATVVHSLSKALETPEGTSTWVIGGKSLYVDSEPFADLILVTTIFMFEDDGSPDLVVMDLHNKFVEDHVWTSDPLTSVNNNILYRHKIYVRKKFLTAPRDASSLSV